MIFSDCAALMCTHSSTLANSPSVPRGNSLFSSVYLPFKRTSLFLYGMQYFTKRIFYFRMMVFSVTSLHLGVGIKNIVYHTLCNCWYIYHPLVSAHQNKFVHERYARNSRTSLENSDFTLIELFLLAW